MDAKKRSKGKSQKKSFLRGFFEYRDIAIKPTRITAMKAVNAMPGIFSKKK